MLLIPTIYKTNISPGLSFPLGAEAISVALSDVPQHAALRLYFRERDEYRAAPWQARVKSGGPLRVLQVNKHGDDEWPITIYAVPSLYKSEIQGRLTVTVLPALKKKLLETPADAVLFDFYAIYGLSSGLLDISCDHSTTHAWNPENKK